MGLEFKGKLRLAGSFATFSGLSVGREKTGKENASLPRMLVRHPVTAVPFIPASCFRGSLRRLFAEGKQGESPEAVSVFGASGPSAPRKGRAAFRDVYPDPESARVIADQNQEGYLSEIKICASMDRVTSQGTSFAIEQIPAGCGFQFEIFFDVLEADGPDLFLALLGAMERLEASSVGGHGSRGLGKIRFGKWSPETLFSPEPLLEAGLELTWYPRKYYESGAGEVRAFGPEDKLLPAGMIENRSKIASAMD